MDLMTASRLDPVNGLDLAIDGRPLLGEKSQIFTLTSGKGGRESTDLIDTLGGRMIINLEDMRICVVTHSMNFMSPPLQWETFGLTLMEAVGAGLGWF